MFSQSKFLSSSTSTSLLQTATRSFSSSSSLPSSFTWSDPHPDDLLRFSPEEVFSAGVRHHHRCNTAFPLNHTATIRPYRVQRLRDQEDIRKVYQGAYDLHKEIMLYVHVPFCHTRCQFCEYTVVNPKVGRTNEAQSAYFDALVDEFKLYKNLLGTDKKTLVGFDIGGGTPSMASNAEIDRVMGAATKYFNLDLTPGTSGQPSMEVSIETTPKIAASEPEKIRAYYKMGIRRISMGLQTTDFKQAKELGREDANAGIDYVKKAVDNIREAGFESFNIDLMYGFPLRAKREDPWAETVRDAIGLAPEHITLYRMRYKGTSMEHLADRVGLEQVNQQEATARKILLDSGYSGLVGKNTYSRTVGSSGCSDYLDKRVVKAVPYIGLGLGAQSFSHHTLSYNLGAVTKKMDQYLRSLELERIPVQDLYHLGKRAAIAKMVSVSFYFGGIDLEAFRSCFGSTLEEIFAPEVNFLVEKKLMVLLPDRLQLTTLGKKHFGGVVALFYSPSVQKYVVNLKGGEVFARDPLTVLSSYEKGQEEEGTLSSSSYISVPTPSHSLPPSAAHPLGEETWRFNDEKNKWEQLPLYPGTSSSSVSSSISLTARAFGTYTSRSFSSVSASSSPFSSSSSLSSLLSSSSTLNTSPRSATSLYEFGNILFGGACNQKCPFCIGKQLDSQLTPENLRTWPIANLDKFTETLRDTMTRKIIFTGTRTDPQLYKYEEKLVDHFREHHQGCHISLHTNGMLASRKLKVFNKYDSATISMNSFEPGTWEKLHGTKAQNMPDLKELRDSSDLPIKLSCIITKDNYEEVKTGKYLDFVRSLGIKRVAFRHLFWSDSDIFRLPELELTGYEKETLFESWKPVKMFCGNPVYDIEGVEVTHWVFDKTTGKSLNLFSNGTISEEYLLAKAPGNQFWKQNEKTTPTFSSISASSRCK